jgi:membrane fusion protein (multidrug efflux system)
VVLRARFPNPQNLLLPGMYVRAKLTQATVSDAILVPQPAVSRTPRGEATVLLIGPGDRALLRPIKVERSIGDKWLVSGGLAAGDRLITEGLIRIKPGQQVRPVPAGSPPQRLAAQDAHRQ